MLYNGSNGTVYDEAGPDRRVSVELWFARRARRQLSAGSDQNGSPDAIALVNIVGVVWWTTSPMRESFVATAGPGVGHVPTEHRPPEESNSTPIGSSLQKEFRRYLGWDGASSFDACNADTHRSR